MSVASLSQIKSFVIRCPVCGDQLRLSTMVPDIDNKHERMSFDCDCGFTYQQSHVVAVERTLDPQETC
jgi:C4-type Zn-finger protein